MKLPFTTFSSWLTAVLLVIIGVMGEHSYQLFDSVASIFSRNTQESAVVGDMSVPFQQTRQINSDARQVDLATMWEVWNYLDSNYLAPEKIETDLMIDGAIRGMTASIGDPYTMYLSPEDNQRSGEDLAGAFFGVGIELGYIDGVLAAVAPLSGSPAEAAGVEAGDLIIRVKDEQKNLDESTTDWSLNKAVREIRGPQKTPVILTLFRPDDETRIEPFDVTILRDEIVVKSVELSYVQHAGKNIANIKLSRFGERTMDEWDDAVNDILRKGAAVDGVVLDMRNNPGGYFNDAIYIVSEFVTDGVVVSQKGRTSERDFYAEGRGRLVGKPLQVLVNKGSASASEIVAGALRDRLSIPLIGENTFGKGTVQDRQMLSNGGGIHVTIAQWMLPGGAWIHEVGIPVTVEAVDDRTTEEDEALNIAIEQF